MKNRRGEPRSTAANRRSFSTNWKPTSAKIGNRSRRESANSPVWPKLCDATAFATRLRSAPIRRAPVPCVRLRAPLRRWRWRAEMRPPNGDRARPRASNVPAGRHALARTIRRGRPREPGRRESCGRVTIHRQSDVDRRRARGDKDTEAVSRVGDRRDPQRGGRTMPAPRVFAGAVWSRRARRRPSYVSCATLPRHRRGKREPKRGKRSRKEGGD